MTDPKKLVPDCTCPAPDGIRNEHGGVVDVVVRDPLCPDHGNFEPPPRGRPEVVQKADWCPPEAHQSDLADVLVDALNDPREFQRRPVDLPPPPAVEDSSQTPPEASADPQPVPPADPAAAFVEASVAVDRRAFTSTAEIMAAARVWCAENDALPFGPRALAEQLKRRRGVQPHSNGQRRGWRGVKLR